MHTHVYVFLCFLFHYPFSLFPYSFGSFPDYYPHIIERLAVCFLSLNGFLNAPEASWRQVFDPCTPLLFGLYHYLEQNGYFWLVPEHDPSPSSQVLPGCRVRHPCYSKKLFVRQMDMPFLFLKSSITWPCVFLLFHHSFARIKHYTQHNHVVIVFAIAKNIIHNMDSRIDKIIGLFCKRAL